MKNCDELLKGDIKNIFNKYVIMNTVGMMMISMYILFDTIFIGQKLGEVGLAALNISIPIYNILFGLGLLIGNGGATIISISLGKSKRDEANSAYQHSIILGICTSLVLTVLGTIFIDDIIKFLGASKDNTDLVKEYLSVVIPFSWAFIMTYNLSGIVRSDNSPRRVMIAMGLGGITNVILDYILIFPLNMGMKGAAIATVTSSLISFVILSWHFIGKYSSLKMKRLKFNSNVFVRILKIGFPSFIVEMSSGLIIFLFNKELILFIGDIGVSAYSIIANINLMATAAFTGVAQGIQPIISTNYGAGNFNRIGNVRKLGNIVAMSIGTVFLLLGLVYPETIIKVFTSEGGEIVEITKSAIRIYFYAFPMIGINVVMSGYFQSIEQTNFSTIHCLMRGIILNFIGLKILTLILGANGIWLTTPIVEVTSLIVIMLFSWINNKQLNTQEKIRHLR